MNKIVKTILLIQLGVIALAALIALGSAGFKAAYSAMIGGGINLLATGYAAVRMFTAKPGSSGGQMLRSLIVAEITKIALTIILFTVVLLYLDVSYAPLFLTYAVTMLAFWLVLPLTAT